MQKVYVIDTNIILNDVENIKRISQDGENIIAIPETVLIELEDKKKDMEDLGYHARAFVRMLAESRDDGVDEGEQGLSVVKYHHNGGTKIHIIAKEYYDCDVDVNHIKESNDKRIIEVTNLAKNTYYKDFEVIFLSIDVYARVFAKIKKIKTETLVDDKKELPDFCYFKSIETEEPNLNGKDIELFDKDRKPETRSYEFILPNGRREYGIIENDKICLIDEDEDFKGLSVKPINIKQKFLMKALLSNNFDTYVVDARAGSGKTLVAISAAMKLMDAYRGKGSTAYQKIVYVRNSIESIDKGADVGYLAGNDEKFRIYNMALYDTLEFIVRKGIKKELEPEQEETIIQEKIEKLISKYNIEKLWPGEARGRTLDDAIVILDEWQNSSHKTSQLIISRLSSTCKLIVIGSNKQIDNLYLNKYNNGLTFMLKKAQEESEHLRFFSIDMEKSVRGKFAQFADEVF